jgi:hypothetical protein
LLSSTNRTGECGIGEGSGVHGAGACSNAMNRFTLTNMRGVLQKVDFFNLIKEK